VAGQRLGVADVHQAREQLQRIDEACTRGLAALDAERQDRGRLAAGVALGQRMLGVVGQAGVFHPGHLACPCRYWATFSAFSDAVHAQGQGFDALQDQEGVERRQRGAGVAQRHHAQRPMKAAGPKASV
jgi:hypothetical protein